MTIWQWTEQKFYQNLYRKHNTEVIDEEREKGILENINRLDEEGKESIEGEIEYEELWAVLKNSKNNKSPGSDGYSYEFIKFFWEDIGYYLLQAINQMYKDSKLTQSFSEGIITCLPKPGKLRENLGNWQPISLLNVGYKLMTACIAERLKSKFQNLIKYIFLKL